MVLVVFDKLRFIKSMLLDSGDLEHEGVRGESQHAVEIDTIASFEPSQDGAELRRRVFRHV